MFQSSTFVVGIDRLMKARETRTEFKVLRNRNSAFWHMQLTMDVSDADGEKHGKINQCTLQHLICLCDKLRLLGRFQSRTHKKSKIEFQSVGANVEKIGTSRQRSGKDAIRKRFPLQKTRWEKKNKLTIRYLYYENIS